MTALTSRVRRGLQRSFSDERGVVVIQVLLASFVLLGVCALSIDYGVMQVARAQAQNAADSAALAAATALAFDVVTTTTAAQQNAVAAARNNTIWGTAVTAGDISVTFCNAVTEGCPAVAGDPTPQPRTYFGATVTMSRNGGTDPAAPCEGNPVPTYFARLFGVDCQSVSAQATAMVAPANTVMCVWPIAVPDWWTGPDLQTFTRYAYPAGPPNLVAMPDVYNPPTFGGSSSATGMQVANLKLSPTAVSLTLTDAVSGPPWPVIDKSHFVAIDVPRDGGGGFAANLLSCNRKPVHIGDVRPLEPGVTMGQVTSAAGILKSRDASAGWNATSRRIQNSCSRDNTCDPPSLLSPRLVAVPLFNPEVYDRTRGDAAGPRIEIVNFVGFYIDDPNAMTGNLTLYPGTVDLSHPSIAYQWALVRTAVLTR